MKKKHFEIHFSITHKLFDMVCMLLFLKVNIKTWQEYQMPRLMNFFNADCHLIPVNKYFFEKIYR